LIHRPLLGAILAEVDLKPAFHPRPCLQFYIKRCLGPCVKDLTHARDLRRGRAGREVLSGGFAKPTWSNLLRERMSEAAEAQSEFERARALSRDLISTRMRANCRKSSASPARRKATAGRSSAITMKIRSLAVNLFHMRGGKVLDRREFFWEETASVDVGPGLRPGLAGRAPAPPRIHPGEFFSALVKQLYLAQPYVRATSTCPSTSRPRELEERSASNSQARADERRASNHRFPSAETNASSSSRRHQRQAVLRPAFPRPEAECARHSGGLSGRARASTVPHPAHRVFRHLAHSGSGTLASMVCGRRPDEKIDTGKFIFKTVAGVDDFALCAKWSRAVTSACNARKKASTQPGAD